MELLAEACVFALSTVPLLLWPSATKTSPTSSFAIGNSDDPILSAFKEAAEFLNNTRGLKMDTETKLAFYGLFKVATHGPCTAPAPSRLDVVAAAKWDAWRAASMFSQHEAMRKYIELASEKVPQWRQRRTPAEVLARDTVKAAAVPGHDLDEYDDDVGDDDDIDDEAADEIPDHEKTFGVSVSRLAETKDVEVEQEDRDLFYYIQEGNLAHVDRLLPSFGDLTQADPDQGMTPLHWASDRNLVDIASSLIKAGAPVDVKDAEDLTPLQYAVTCGHEQMVKLLLSHGAKASCVDVADITSSSASIQAYFLEYSKPDRLSQPSSNQRRPSDSSWASFSIPMSPPVEDDGDMLIVGNASSQRRMSLESDDDIDADLMHVTLKPKQSMSKRK